MNNNRPVCNLRVAVALCTLLALCGCHKESAPEGLLLSVEGYSNTAKTAVQDMNIYWVDGDRILLNGQECTVTLNGSGQARAVGYTGSGAIRGYSPASLTVSGADSDAPTVTLPAEYTSRFDGQRQIIDLPMAATAASETSSLMFKHLSAAVQVRVRNDYAYPLFLDSVVVLSETYQLCGDLTLDLTAPDLGAVANTAADGAMRRVRVSFARNSVSIAPGGAEVRNVQVPILPIGDDNFTVKVYAHRWIEGMLCDAATHTFTHTASTGALARNVMLKAQVAFAESNTHVTSVRRGEFTVNGSGKKVFFSRGNLQYTIATGEWSFLEHQYDVVETGNVSADYADQSVVGLFGWGTNGVAIEGRFTAPTATAATSASYGPAEGNLAQAQDWGHNPITNGGNVADQWRTLGNVEWNYVFISRTTGSTIDGKGNALYAKATVAGKTGVILFPDEYIHPSISVVSGKLSDAINNSKATYALVSIDAANWAKMEQAGAVLLPTTGYRNGYAVDVLGSCYYWSSTTQTSTQARAVQALSNTSLTCYSSQPRAFGFAVRLVQDAN